MEQHILCQDKLFKLFLLFINRINVWGDEGGGGGRFTADGIDTNTSAKIVLLLFFL